jgi:antitoxin ParD1/3/4
MNVSLTSELEQYVQQKIGSGLYTSASEVIRESLRLMHAHDDLQKQHIKQLNQSIEQGLMQLARGEKISAKDSYHRVKARVKTDKDR